MKMGKNEAIRSIHKLIKGEPDPEVFRQCTYCFNCNNYCPVEGLRPHELILQRNLEHRGKVPTIFSYLSNGMSAPNLFEDIYNALHPGEKKILEKWSEIPPPTKEILWIGCVGKMSCYDIENSNILKSLPKYGPPDLCCGELAYRLGSWDMYKKTIERTLEQFEKLNIEQMVCYCGSCYNYFSKILPKVYGKTLPFKLTSMYQWMWEKVEKNELKLENPLNYRAAVHESCYVSELEPEFPIALQNLYKAAGMEVVELDHCGANNFSCGAVSVVRNLNLFQSMIKVQRQKYSEVKKTGVNEIALNCPGCYITMSFTSRIFNKKLHYMADELLHAYGDNITIPLGKRIPLFAKTMTKKLPGRFMNS